MSLSHLSQSTQNYLKAVWNLEEWSRNPVTATTLAARVGVKISTASDAIKKLTHQGLLRHARYGSITLTPQGRQYAVAMVRRHRLIETFLVEMLGYQWDQVHDEAEKLEHAVSDFMVDRMDERLGYPQRDPHGDPIPGADGTLRSFEAILLSEFAENQRARIERISDANSELLQFFANNGIGYGTLIETQSSLPFSETVEIKVLGQESSVSLGRTASDAVWVCAVD